MRGLAQAPACRRTPAEASSEETKRQGGASPSVRPTQKAALHTLMTVSTDFVGKIVLVTGGTKGVGLGIARVFLCAGATVLVCARNAPVTLPEANGNQARFIQTDLTDADQIGALIDGIAATHGKLDVLVNNAGGTPFALTAHSSPRLIEKLIRLNLTSPLWVAQKANAVMQAQESGGVIVFIASVSALRPSPGSMPYGAAKAGVLSAVTSLAVEWAPKVRVVAVTPGMVRTEQSHLHYGDEAGIAAVAATVPAGRLAEPEDIGQACAFLASPAASYATGTNLVLHGGGEVPAFLAAANTARS